MRNPFSWRDLGSGVLVPLAALALQWASWPYLRPFVWFLFYPAVFLSSWLGGKFGGLIATGLSTLFVWFFFIPTEGSFAIEDPRFVLSMGMFAGMGVLFSTCHEGWRTANRRTTEALAAMHAANEQHESHVRDRTQELQQTAEAHRESEARLRTVTDTSHVGLVIVDEQHRYRYANRAYAEILRLPATELVGRCVADVLVSVYVEQVRPRLERAFRGERVNHELLMPAATPGQAGRLYAVSYEPGADRSGKVVIVVIADITERKEAEHKLGAALRQAGDLRRALDEHAIVAITDVRGVITAINEKFCTISQYTREELLGHDHRIINSGYHSKAFFGEMWSTIRAGRVWHGDFRNRAKDGSFYWVNSTIVPLLDEATGQPRHFIAIRADITERKVAEQALRESEERMRSLVTMLPDALFISQDDRIVYINQCGLQLWRAERAEQILGRSPFEFVHPDWHGRVRERIRHMMTDGTAAPLWETRMIALDGTVIPVETTAVLFSYGGKAAIQVVVRDITERRRAEDEIRQLNTGLELRVAQRTAELEAANRELEAFSYSVSHDLRAPLRAIDGFSEAVLRDYGPHLPADGVRRLGIIREGAQRMGELIDDLLTFSRLSRQALVRHEVDVRRLVEGVLGELQAERIGRAVEIDIGALPGCRADRNLLKQVWVNLLSNAHKYTRGRDPARIRIGCRSHNGVDEYFVEDNGTGFDMRYAAKLFRVFQRLHPAEEFEGTGVGLAIVERIIHRHGGRVGVEAAVDRGATFFFTLGVELEPLLLSHPPSKGG